MIEMLGYVMVMSAFVMMGIILYLNEKISVKQRQAIIHLFDYIQNGLLKKNKTLFEIYSGFYDPELEKCGFLKILKSSDYNSLYKAFSECQQLKIGKKEREKLLDFSLNFGKSESYEKIYADCTAIKDITEKEFISENKKSSERGMLFLKLSPLAGIFALILIV